MDTNAGKSGENNDKKFNDSHSVPKTVSNFNKEAYDKINKNKIIKVKDKLKACYTRGFD